VFIPRFFLNRLLLGDSQLTAARAARSEAFMRLPVLSSPDAVCSLWRNRLPKRVATEVFASYASHLRAIVTDPALVAIPLDDHGFHRGHAVFDTCNVANGLAYGLSFHLDRLLASAKQARISNVPAKEELKSIILQTIAATQRRDGVFVRYWLTAGRGDFSISPRHCTGEPGFYVVAHQDAHSADGLREFKAITSTVPLKPAFLATMKSNNYLLNALVAMEAESKGAHLGIQLDDEGVLAESAVSTIGVVGGDGVLRSPVPHSILPSTTWGRAKALAPLLVDRGILNGCEEGTVSREQLHAAHEIISFGGGWVESICELDGAPVGWGVPGRVFLALDDVLQQDLANPEHVDAVPYSPHSTG